jgi:Protein of unknown function (DUF2934)
MSVRAAVQAKLAPVPAVLAAAASALGSGGEITAEARGRMIAEAAYYIAERRGFEPGYEFEDWLAAEAEVDRDLEMAGLAVAAT